MKRLRIKYTPPLVQGAALFTLLAISVVAGQFIGSVAVYIGILFTIIMFLGFSSIGSVVKFGSGNIIKCNCLFYMWKIDLDEIEAFSYSIESHATRGGARFSFDIRFYNSMTDSDDCYVLRKMIDKDDIVKFMNSEIDRIDLMKIYRYAESVHPEKAKGYVKAGDNYQWSKR